MANPREDGCIHLGEYVLSFERELCQDFQEKAESELRETPEVRDAAVAKLRQLVKADKNKMFVPNDRVDTFVLFLRACKFYPEEAFELMKRFYNFKANNPKLCKELLPSKDGTAFKHELLTILPKRDQHGRRVMVMNIGEKWDPSECGVYEYMRSVVMMTTASLFEPKTQVAGGVVLLDMEGLGVTQVIQVSPRLASIMLDMIQNCMPLRLKAIHIINQPYIFNMLYAIFKPFLHEKLRNRLYFHGTDREELLQHIGAKYLPIKYGGDLDLPDIPGNDLYEFFCHLEEDYRKIAPFGYSKERSKNEDDIKEGDVTIELID